MIHIIYNILRRRNMKRKAAQEESGSLKQLYTCVVFKANIEANESSNLAICHNCNIGQKLINASYIPFLIQDQNGGKITVCGYTKGIIGDNNLFIEQLLIALQFDVEYNIFHVIPVARQSLRT